MVILNKYKKALIATISAGNQQNYFLFLLQRFVLLFVLTILWFNSSSQRQVISLDKHWYTIASEDDKLLPVNSYQTLINASWKSDGAA